MESLQTTFHRDRYLMTTSHTQAHTHLVHPPLPVYMYMYMKIHVPSMLAIGVETINKHIQQTHVHVHV